MGSFCILVSEKDHIGYLVIVATKPASSTKGAQIISIDTREYGSTESGMSSRWLAMTNAAKHIQRAHSKSTPVYMQCRGLGIKLACSVARHPGREEELNIGRGGSSGRRRTSQLANSFRTYIGKSNGPSPIFECPVLELCPSPVFELCPAESVWAISQALQPARQSW